MVDDETGSEGRRITPEAMDSETVRQYLVKHDPLDDSRAIRNYVNGELRGEGVVTHAELVATELVMDREHTTWDVHTTEDRYWVITNPMNLYAQRLFPSADDTLSFHIGLMARAATRTLARGREEHAERVSLPWRRWDQAAEAFSEAREAEDFQAVAMRCRECLLALVRAIQAEWKEQRRELSTPKAGDFVSWSDLIADKLAEGATNERLRSYLKSLAKETWQLAQAMTHKRGARAEDASIVLNATKATLSAFSGAVLRYERGAPSECPDCGSYQVTDVFALFAPPASSKAPFPATCRVCGWTNALADPPEPESV